MTIKYDAFGEIRLMAQADGYCMCRRPHKMPFVITLKEWLSKPEQPHEKGNTP